jgi:hypothetical protein
MLIGLSGLAQAGKDTVAGILVREHGFKQKALATKMKEAALALDPVIDFEMIMGPAQTIREIRPVRLSELIEKVGAEEAKKHPEVRRLYQRLGTEMGRNVIDGDLWVKLVFRGVQQRSDIVISDVRFLNELTAIVNRDGCVWRIVRPGAGLEGEHAAHRSEKDLFDDSDIYDYVIHNDGSIEDLSKKVADALEAGRAGL